MSRALKKVVCVLEVACLCVELARRQVIPAKAVLECVYPGCYSCGSRNPILRLSKPWIPDKTIRV